MLTKKNEAKNLLALVETRCTQVPLQDSNEWTQHWIRYKPASILPNCFLMSSEILLGYLEREGVDLVVAFLGLHKLDDPAFAPGFLHLFLCPARQNGPKEGDFTLLHDMNGLVLCHPSFDPILKDSLSAPQKIYVGDPRFGRPISLEKALEWTRNWYEYSEELNLGYPQYIVYTKAEVLEMATVPTSDHVRVTFCYKPTDQPDTFLLDFVFFASASTANGRFSAMNVLRPNAIGGTDMGCICPPDTCCGCTTCDGTSVLKTLSTRFNHE